MAFSTRQKVLAAIIAVLAFIVGQAILYQTLSFQNKAIVFRAEFVAIAECVMFLFSRTVWKTFVPVIKEALSPPSMRLQQSAETSANSTSNGLCRSSLWKNKTSDVDLTAHSSKIYPGEQNGSLVLTFMKVALFTYLLMCQISYLTNLFIIDTDPHWFGMLSYACLGSFVQLLTGMGIFKLLSFVVKICRNGRTLRGTSSGFSQKQVAALSLIYMMAASTIGLYTASQPPKVVHVSVPIRNLPSNLEGLTIVQLSDIHLGPTVGFSKLLRIVEIVQKAKPDVVVLTGDLVDGSVHRLKGAAQPLSSIDSEYGKFFVTGNHEYYTGDVDNWFIYLQSLGFTILHNSNAKVPAHMAEGDGQICFAGTDDVTADKIGYNGHTFGLDSAVSSCTDDMTVILLAHQPVAAKMALDSRHKIDLVLSGHTHGGQMFPLILGAYLLNPFYSGLYQYGERGSYVYVSQGTQYWGIPMRIGTSMEITRITLTKAV